MPLPNIVFTNMSGSRFNFSIFPLNFVVVDFLGWFPPDNFPPDKFQIRQLPRGQVPDQKERLLQKVFRGEDSDAECENDGDDDREKSKSESVKGKNGGKPGDVVEKQGNINTMK